MIERFDTYEAAALYVEKKRAEGLYAEILNDNVGFLWGPRTVGGFRVQVHEGSGPLPERPVPESDSFVSHLVRVLVVLFLLAGIVAGLVTALNAMGATVEIILGIMLVLGIGIGGGYFIFRKGFPRNPH